MKPIPTRLALLLSALGAGIASPHAAAAGELTDADLCSTPMAVGCAERAVKLRPAPLAIEVEAKVEAPAIAPPISVAQPPGPASEPPAVAKTPARRLVIGLPTAAAGGASSEQAKPGPAAYPLPDAVAMPPEAAVAGSADRSTLTEPTAPLAIEPVLASWWSRVPENGDAPAPPPTRDEPPATALARNEPQHDAAVESQEPSIGLITDPSPPAVADEHAEGAPTIAEAALPEAEHPVVADDATVAEAPIWAPAADQASGSQPAERPEQVARRDDALPEAARVAAPAGRSEVTFAASHADKVLLNLQTLMANDGFALDRLLEPAKEIVVVDDTERVMMTLARVLSDCDAYADRLEAADAEASFALDSEHLDIDLASLDALAQAWPALPGSASEATTSARSRPAPRAAPVEPPVLGAQVALAEGALDHLRGGFTRPDGLQVSFGIERATYVNGNLVTATSFNIADPTKAIAGQVPLVGIDKTSGLALVQSGAGNIFQPGALSASSVGTVIQNTLNDQKIQNVTVINATVNSLEMLRSLNLQQNLRSAVIDSLRR